MTRFDPAYVNSDDPDDLELGAGCWSKTHVRDGGMVPRGGTIVGLNLDDSDALVSVFTLEQHAGRLDIFEIVRSDVAMDTVRWYARDARVAAEIINRWLGSRNAPRDYRVKALWQRRAFELAEVGASGQWLPGADRRARRHEAANRGVS